MKIDYHIHSTVSPDGKGSMEDMCRAAIDTGLEEIVFTDHYEFYAGTYTSPYFHEEYLMRYFRELESCRKLFGSSIEIRSGMEFGQMHLKPDRANKVIETYAFDYILASVHKINNVDLSRMDYTIDSYRQIAEIYYEHLLAVASVADYDCLGHLDLYKRHSRQKGFPDCFKEHREVIAKLLSVVIERGKGIEINTSGLRQGVCETMPGYEIMQLYRELGGTIVTVGSDAHAPYEVGADIDKVCEWIKKAGFSHVARYENRRCQLSELR